MPIELEGMLGYSLPNRFSNSFRICKRPIAQVGNKLITAISARCSLFPDDVSDDLPTFGDGM